MKDHGSSLVEFTQPYDDGSRVIKRGIDASHLVIKKYGILPDEVMAFSNWQKSRTAITAFHFHPDFPIQKRNRYMEAHGEGHEIVVDVMTSNRRERMDRLQAWNGKAARAAYNTRRVFNSALYALIALAVGTLQEQIR